MRADSDEFTVRPDAKGRITLGKLAKGISSFRVTKDKNGGFHLKPYVEIPEQDHWIFKNPQALASLKRGLQQIKDGDTHNLGDFSKYLDDEDK